MNDVVRLMGIERREYTDKSTGELKAFCGLHVVYEQYEAEDGMKGKKCESFSCPRDVDYASLELNKCYELCWSHYKTKNGMAARISDLLPVDMK